MVDFGAISRTGSPRDSGIYSPAKFLFFISKLEKMFIISPSLLHTREMIADFSIFLVLFSNQKTDLDISLSLLDLTFWHLVNAIIITITIIIIIKDN